MSFKPTQDRVLVEVEKAEDKSKGGIVLPDVAKKRPWRGKVVAVGPGRVLDNGEDLPVELNVGDRVVFNQYAGAEIDLGDERELLVLRESEVLGVL